MKSTQGAGLIGDETFYFHPIILLPDYDSSDYAIGGVISQVQGGEEKVIAYGSKMLNKAERN